MRQSANVNEDVSFEEKRSHEEKGGIYRNGPSQGMTEPAAPKETNNCPAPDGGTVHFLWTRPLYEK